MSGVNTVDLVSTDTTPPPPKGLPATTHSLHVFFPTRAFFPIPNGSGQSKAFYMLTRAISFHRCSYYVMLILALAFLALIIAILVTLRDQAFCPLPRSTNSNSNLVVRSNEHNIPPQPIVLDQRMDVAATTQPKAENVAKVMIPTSSGSPAFPSINANAAAAAPAAKA